MWLECVNLEWEPVYRKQHLILQKSDQEILRPVGDLCYDPTDWVIGRTSGPHKPVPMSMWSLRWHFTNKSITGAPYSIKSYSLSHSWTLWCVLLPRVSVGKKTEGRISRGQYLLLIQVGVENDIQEVFQFVIIVCVYVSVHKCLSVLLFVVGDWCLPLIPLVVAVIQPSTALWSYCKQNVSTSFSTPLPFLSVAAKYSLLFMWPFYFAFFLTYKFPVKHEPTISACLMSLCSF